MRTVYFGPFSARPVLCQSKAHFAENCLCIAPPDSDWCFAAGSQCFQASVPKSRLRGKADHEGAEKRKGRILIALLVPACAFTGYAGSSLSCFVPCASVGQTCCCACGLRLPLYRAPKSGKNINIVIATARETPRPTLCYCAHDIDGRM